MNKYYLFSSGYSATDEEKDFAEIKSLSFDGENIALIDENSDFASPSYSIISQDELFVVEERDHGASAGSVSFTKDGMLGVSKKFDVKGDGLCHIEEGEKAFYASGYSGGNLPIFTRDGDMINFLSFEGSGVNSLRQEKAHIHSALISPNGKFLVVVDLGTDLIHKYEITKDSGDITDANTQPTLKVRSGAGPRHFVFSKSRDIMYLLCELSEAIYSYNYDPETMEMTLFEEHFIRGELNDTLYGEGADIRINTTENLLYVSDRNDNQIHCYKITENGSLKKINEVPSGGICPRNIALSSDDKYLAVANQNSGNIAIFETDQDCAIKNNPIATYKHPKVSCIRWR